MNVRPSGDPFFPGFRSFVSLLRRAGREHNGSAKQYHSTALSALVTPSTVVSLSLFILAIFTLSVRFDFFRVTPSVMASESESGYQDSEVLESETSDAGKEFKRTVFVATRPTMQPSCSLARVVSDDEASEYESDYSEASEPEENLPQPKIRCCASRPGDREPNNMIQFEFLAEGGANAVYRIRPCPPDKDLGFVFVDEDNKTIPRAQMINKVLRMSKCVQKTLRCQAIIKGFEEMIRPLFRPSPPANTVSNGNAIHPPEVTTQATSFEHFLLDHECVFLERDVLNTLLFQTGPNGSPIVRKLESKGLLLPDMSSIPGSSVTIELKPKWLAQSPNAPNGSYRCRTCALHAQRYPYTDAPSGTFFCPLQLVAGNGSAIEAFLKDRIRKELGTSHTSAIEATVLRRVVPYITTGPGHQLIKYLRNQQQSLDPDGVMYEPPTSEMDFAFHRLRLAMTLRDCSLLIRVPYADENAPIEAKLADLDFKSEDKIVDWYQKEGSLIQEGWYTNYAVGGKQCCLSQGWNSHVPTYV